MFTLITNLIPIILGAITKLVAIRSQNASDQQKMMIEAMANRANITQEIRSSDTPASAANRRALLWFLMAMVATVVVGGAIFSSPIYVEQVQKGLSLFGIIDIVPDSLEWIKLEAGSIVAFDEVFVWMSILIEFMLGASIVRR